MTDNKDIQTQSPDEKPLTPRQNEVVDYLTSHRCTVAEAAEALGMDRTNLYRILRYQHVKTELRERLSARLAAGAVMAGEELLSLLHHKSAYVRLQASQEIMKLNEDKTAQGPSTAIQVNIDLG